MPKLYYFQGPKASNRVAGDETEFDDSLLQPQIHQKLGTISDGVLDRGYCIWIWDRTLICVLRFLRPVATGRKIGHVRCRTLVGVICSAIVENKNVAKIAQLISFEDNLHVILSQLI